jgi:threonine dehydratase
MSVTLEDVVRARERIAGAVQVTPCTRSAALSDLCGFSLHLKHDYQQRTGSFKERGARNALLLLTEEQRARGVIAASAGNHALGLSYHGQLLGIPVTVVMPILSPLIKSETCKGFGATVILHGENIAEAKQFADEIAARDGLTYINGYDDAAIIAGQGTIGLEILEQAPHVDAIVVPIGGGGLIAGIALAVKSKRSDVEIIGVEPAHAASFQCAIQAGEPVMTEVSPTLADGLAVPKVGPRSFEVARRRIDRMVIVEEDPIAAAILKLVELEKCVVEGAGASSVAACLSGQLGMLKGKTVVAVLCGGNIDPLILSRAMERGLVINGRICRFTATISDRPGGLAQLTALIASLGASIKEVVHDRTFAGPNLWSVNVHCTIETRDMQHREMCFERMRDAGVRLLSRDL